MSNYVIADNQELTCFAIESLLQNNEGNVVRAFNRAGLVSMLTQHP